MYFFGIKVFKKVVKKKIEKLINEKSEYSKLIISTNNQPPKQMSYKSTSSMKKYCKVCKDSGKSEREYRSHNTKDRSGRTMCPTLQSLICRYCHESGHTPKYCSKLVARRERVGSASYNGNKRSGDYNQPGRHHGNTRRAPPSATADHGWDTVTYTKGKKNLPPTRFSQDAYTPMYPEEKAVLMALQREAAEKDAPAVVDVVRRRAEISSTVETHDTRAKKEDFPSIVTIKARKKKNGAWGVSVLNGPPSESHAVASPVRREKKESLTQMWGKATTKMSAWYDSDEE